MQMVRDQVAQGNPYEKRLLVRLAVWPLTPQALQSLQERLVVLALAQLDLALPAALGDAKVADDC